MLTNNHVVDGATDVKVTLSDKREFKAKDHRHRSEDGHRGVEAGQATNFPAITLGDSSKVQVGDYALAIGDPFGVGQTVTMGIVSAKGRGNLGIEDYEDFIQTDAPINPGNSGGALVNDRGELVGINTAILSHGSGGNEGIGFAIPDQSGAQRDGPDHGSRQSDARLPRRCDSADYAGHGEGARPQQAPGRAGRRREREGSGAKLPGVLARRRHPVDQRQHRERQQRAAQHDLDDAAGRDREARRSRATAARRTST